MRKVSFCTVAVMALVGLLGFGGTAQAQNEALVLDNVMGWWDHLSCEKKINAVNAIDGLDGDHTILAGDETYSSDANDSTRQWCQTFNDLGQNEQRAVNAGAKQSRADGGITTAADDRVFDKTGWYEGMMPEGQQMAIGAAAAPVTTLAAATSSVAGQIDAAYMALMSGMMPEEEAPAIPLVGLGILGLVLAGRGAWLRRRA